MPKVVPRSYEDEEGLKEHVLLGIIELMKEVSAAQGLDNKVGVLLSNLNELLGGTNTRLYTWLTTSGTMRTIWATGESLIG